MAEEENFLDSSDEEGEVDLSPFSVSWLDLSFADCDEKLGISGLPGCRFKDTWRSLDNDLKCLHQDGVEEVFCLCTKGELNKFRVPRLLLEYSKVEMLVHHYPFPDGLIPSMPKLMKMVEEIRVNLMNRKSTIIQCIGGLGRSCLVAACLSMLMDESLAPDAAIEKLRALRGPGAIQSVKQFNFVQEFRQLLADYYKDEDGSRQSLSR